MRAVALLGAFGSLAMTAFAAVPAHPALPSQDTPSQDPSPARAVSPSASPPPTPEARGTALAARRGAAAGVRFGTCPEAEHLRTPVRCGTVTVPLDYAAPDGKQITLTVSRVTATGGAADRTGAATTGAARSAAPVRRQGALVFHPGGPGATGMFFPTVSDLSYWKPIAAAYDLVGYAPRGVGRSAPLSCQDPKQYAKAPTPAPVHPSASYKKDRVAEAKAYAQGCLRRNGGALRHYTTLNNARDLEVLRAALGERRLTFMGVGYGSYLGAVYATLFPSHVRRLVFDSAVDPDPGRIWYRDRLARSAAFERRWADFRAWMARHDAAYGLGTTSAQVQRSYEKARDRLAREPAGGKVGPGQLQAAFLKATYYDDYWPMRAAALSAYLDGAPELLVAQTAPIEQVAAEQEGDAAVNTAVECNDAPWPTDWATWNRDASRLARTAPFAAWSTTWTHLPCAYWPVPRQRPVDVRAAAGVLPPTLILASERDAVTPYEGARELRRRLKGSVLVTERGSGLHGIGGGPNDCVNARLRTYLLTGRTPARDTECAPHPEPEPLSTG